MATADSLLGSMILMIIGHWSKLERSFHVAWRRPERMKIAARHVP
jgi:hypothetical protein